MADHELLDIEEWELVLSKMLKFHFNISEEIKAVVQVPIIMHKKRPALNSKIAIALVCVLFFFFI